MVRKRVEKKQKEILSFWDRHPHHHYRSKRYSILGLSILVLLMIYFFKDGSFILRAVSTAAFLIFFYIVDHVWDIRFGKRHYVYIVIIALASFLLSPLYFIYPNYDKIQHFIQPMLVFSITFHMVSKLKLELKWKLAFTFFIIVGILGLFEIGEYTLDHLFDMKLQGVYLRDFRGIEKFNLLVDPIDDTMIDMVFGVFGACLYGGFIFIYMRYYSKQLKFKR
jgi:hypothetical protein